MYAVVETGGKQYRVSAGDVIDVELLSHDPGATVELGQVLMVAPDGAPPTFGRPVVAGAKVMAEVVDQIKGDKVIVFKYKPKVRYRRKTGHRQNYTRLRVTEIVAEA
ncbi:MAG: 50S ribosomal protein L21 [Chloroflexota bacterium]